MFDTLSPPTDAGSARARLASAATELAGSRPVLHLPSPARGPGAGPGWPSIPAEVGVVVADTVLWEATLAQLKALARAIGPDQVLVFFEPTADAGWRRGLHRLARPVWRRLVGHHFESDVPSILRAAGLPITDLNRFGVGPLDVGSYVLGKAQHTRVAPADPGSDVSSG